MTETVWTKETGGASSTTFTADTTKATADMTTTTADATKFRGGIKTEWVKENVWNR
jgi:hypothetical protein